MTSNQLKYWELREEQRHNAVSEGETQRHNVVSEAHEKQHVDTERIRAAEEAQHWFRSDLTNMIGSISKLAGPLSGGTVGAIIGG